MSSAQEKSDTTPTPSPWQADVDHQPNETPLIIAHTKPEGNAYVVAEVNQDGLLEGNWKANARLIAAAPKLLEVAKRFLQYEHGVDDPGQFMDDIEATKEAIAKVEGRTSESAQSE